MKKGYLQISFTWLFAIIVGAFILFIAIYASTKLIKTGQDVSDAKLGKEIGVLLNPLETGFESSKTTSLTMPVETIIHNKCEKIGNFGKQIISLSQKSFGKWTDTDFEAGFENKYIFSEKNIEGKKFYVFSKPFYFPYKIADLIYLTSSEKDYCFIDAPDDIKQDLEDLQQPNIIIENCSEQADEIEVCFNDFSGSCEITVRYNLKEVEKNNNKIYFETDALMFAAIFSDLEIYECQIKRLMKRAETLALIYEAKANFVSREGCNSNINFLELKNIFRELETSSGLNTVNFFVEDASNKNDFSDCRLW
ncbi:hypothetical protein K9L16_01465 [Candidatus Pacearchaeota archaeon]|nr:hypothetical protein [Candidatus Pacearchaeota archaeon]